MAGFQSDLDREPFRLFEKKEPSNPFIYFVFFIVVVVLSILGIRASMLAADMGPMHIPVLDDFCNFLIEFWKWNINPMFGG